MNSGIDESLDHVDQWKLQLHDKLKRMTPLQREAFWQQIREQARTRGLRVVEPEKKAKRPTKRARRTG
jgi:hypothetical protein